MAKEIDTHASHTREIASFEEKTRERHMKRDMPELINKKDQDRLDSTNKVIDT